MKCDVNKLLESAAKASSLPMLQAHVRRWVEDCPAEEMNARHPRKTSKRALFMGECMRSPSKGGQGKDMKTCSDEWKAKAKQK